MTIRLQADVNLNQIIVRAACRREPALDFQTPEAAGLSGLPDLDVLNRAAEENRVVVTHDLQTMPQHFATFILTRLSAGLLIVPQSLPIASVVDDLLLIWSTMDAAEWVSDHCHESGVALHYQARASWPLGGAHKSGRLTSPLTARFLAALQSAWQV